MTDDWQIRDSVIAQAKLDEIFNVLTKISDHLDIDITLEQKRYNHTELARFDKGVTGG